MDSFTGCCGFKAHSIFNSGYEIVGFCKVNEDKKKSITGQMSLFDLVPEEEKSAYEIRLPDVPEYGWISITVTILPTSAR